MRDNVKYWLELSEYDIKTAEAMLVSKRYLYVGFMAHQAIEKILKAYFVQIKNQTAPFSHSLSYRNFSITGGSKFCRSPVLWAIVGLQHYAGIFIALGTGLLLVVTVLPPFIEKLRHILPTNLIYTIISRKTRKPYTRTLC